VWCDLAALYYCNRGDAIGRTAVQSGDAGVAPPFPNAKMSEAT